MVVLVTHMNGIQRVMLGDDLIQGNHFPCVAVAAGSVFQAVRETYGTKGQLPVQQGAHLL